MHIRLELKGRVLHEVDAADIQSELVVGRSSSCNWRTPDGDAMIGSRHARIYVKRGRIWLEDLDSKNGTWFRGKKIKQKKLQEGDRISIGSCVLIVEQLPSGTVSKVTPEIVVMTGAGRGQRKPVQGPSFTIGSDPKASLLFLDNLVSRQHAVIVVKGDGSCWIKDCNSKNGTKVNDLPLRPDQERVLKDGDRVAIAHLEFSFYDGTSQKIKGQALRRLAILVLTVLVAVGGYYGYLGCKPPAKWYLDEAEQAAKKEQFERAQQLLKAATSARGYDAVKVKAEILRRNLPNWATVLKTWEQARLALESGKWEEALHALGLLQTMTPDAWMWGSAGDRRDQALGAKNLLDVYFDALHTDDPLENLKRKQTALGLVVAKQKSTQPYLGTLCGKLREQNDILKKQLDSYRELDLALDNLNTWSPPPDTAKAKEKISQICKSADGPLKDRAGKLLGPVEALDSAFQQLQQTMLLALQMRLPECRTNEIRLPSQDSCSMDQRLSVLRHNIENADANMKSQVATLSALLGAFTNRVGMADAFPVEVLLWDNEGALTRVLACDCFKKPFPRRSRKEPGSDYDRFLGVEYFYIFLRAQSERQGSRWSLATDATPFVTVLRNTMLAFEDADAVRGFFSRPENRWLQRDQLGLVAAKAQNIMGRRDLLVQRMLDLAKREKGRSAVIAAGIALHLAENPASLNVDGMSLKMWITAQVNSLNQTVEQLFSERERASLPRRIEIRKQIIENGLPGNPTVNSMWQEMTD